MNEELIGDSIAILMDPAVRGAVGTAWVESEPGLAGGHEEGGFVLSDPSGNLWVERWPRGGRNEIAVPPHQDCRVGDHDIIASFHTHPNSGPSFLQEPSETDRRAILEDPDLGGVKYLGEFVISSVVVYRFAGPAKFLSLGPLTSYYSRGKRRTYDYRIAQ
jgi:hypothetical protein